MFQLIVALLTLFLRPKPVEQPAANPPNIVILLADDLGYADVGFHGSDIQTPHLDALASDGVRLENFYSCPMCSPTRAGLLTGRYPIRYGMMRAVIPPYRNFGLAPSEDLLPELLARANYQHRAVIGKWHLGHLNPKWHPNQQGFTHFVGCYNGAVDYFSRIREGEVDWHRNQRTEHTEGYVTDLIADESVAFIESVPVSEPYFLYVPFTAPHSPFQAKAADEARYSHRKGKQRTYAAMVDCMDQGIGRILEAINRRGDRENTFILFFSDNGGVVNVADNAPMRGHKLTVFDGGIRVAAAAHWPAGGVRGGRVVQTRMGYIDVFPTIKSVINSTSVSINPLDGVDVLSHLQGKEQELDRPWFTYLDQNPKKREAFAIHYQDWKLLLEQDAPDTTSDRTDRKWLFQLGALHRETEQVQQQYPDTLRHLLGVLQGFSALKQDQQIQRYYVGKSGFTPPKDWVIQ